MKETKSIVPELLALYEAYYIAWLAGRQGEMSFEGFMQWLSERDV